MNGASATVLPAPGPGTEQQRPAEHRSARRAAAEREDDRGRPRPPTGARRTVSCRAPSAAPRATSATVSHRPAEDLRHLRARRRATGRARRRSGPSATTSPSAITTTRSATSATNSTSWVATTHAAPVGRRARGRPAEGGLGGVVEPAGRLVEQQRPAGRAVSCDASTSASRCPSRQVARVRSPVDARARSGRAGPRRCPVAAAGLAVGRVALRRARSPGTAGRDAVCGTSPTSARVPRRPGRPRGSTPPTSTVPASRAARALQRPQQRRLAGAVAAHQRVTSPACTVEVDVAHGDRAP